VTFLDDAGVPFDLTVGRQDSTVTVAVVGEVDLATAPRLSAALGGHGDAERVVLDLTAATFIDSTGLRVLIEADRRCAATSRRFVLVVDDGPVLRLLELCDLDRRMDVVSGRSHAALDRPPRRAKLGTRES
jgi:anti-sigma B factor antagonist